MLPDSDIYTPYAAKIVEFIQEQQDIFTLRLQFTNAEIAAKYSFKPGQFNMVYMFGVGEIAISIVNEHNFTPGMFEHTIQVVGRLTNGMNKLTTGDIIGIRGPFGSSWPIEIAKGKNVIMVSGGLGNAPLVAATEEILRNRSAYGSLHVIHGIRSSDLLIYDQMYERWNNSVDTRVMMATSHANPIENGKWLWKKGMVTDYIPELQVDTANSIVMTVGPEPMMKAVAEGFVAQGMNPENIYLSLERSMKCGIGHCGHCQLGAQFICKDGPIYPYSVCAHLLAIKGL